MHVAVPQQFRSVGWLALELPVMVVHYTDVPVQLQQLVIYTMPWDYLIALG